MRTITKALTLSKNVKQKRKETKSVGPSNTSNTSNTTADVKMNMGIAKEVTDDVISKINDLYITYRGRFTIVSQGGFYSPKSKAGYLKLKNANIWSHLQRTYAVAVYCGKSGSKFVCFDIDDGDCDTVSSVVNGIGEATGISRDFIYVSYSGGKGYHVEVFFDDLVPMDCMRKLYRTVIKRHELNPKKVEFRPTPSQSIKLPLSVHQRTGNICWFVDRDTLEPIESYEYIFGIKQCSAELFQDFVNDIDPDEGTETEVDGQGEISSPSAQNSASNHDLKGGSGKGTFG